MNYSDSTKYLSIKETIKISQAIGNSKKDTEIIDFGRGDTDMLISSDSIKKLTRSLINGEYKYSSSKGNRELLEKLATINNVSRDNIAIGNGASSLFYLTLKILFNTDDEIVIMAPYWPVYKTQSNIEGIVPRIFKLDNKLNFQSKNLDSFIKKLKKPKAIVINNPNNPSGKVFSKKELQDIIKISKKYKLTIISDEVYSDIVFSPTKYYGMLDVSKDLKNIVIINSASKNYGMSGFRIGYLISNNEFIEKIVSLISETVSNVPEFIQTCLLNELHDVKKHKRNIEDIGKKLAVAIKEIKKSKNLVLNTYGNTIYLFPKLKDIKYKSEEFSIKLAKEYGVIVTPGIYFGMENYIRISIGNTSIKNIKKGLDLINKFIEKNKI